VLLRLRCQKFVLLGWGHGNTVRWGTMLQARRSGVRSPTRPLNFSSLPNPSRSSVALGFTHPLTEMSVRKCFWGVKRVRLTISPPSVSQLYRKCEVIDVSRPCRLPMAYYKNSFIFCVVRLKPPWSGHLLQRQTVDSLPVKLALTGLRFNLFVCCDYHHV
jgi:hypothetical protein